ncbi:hypothetical protein [Burkholderia ambifaria]|uniref:hypothetical protein n=1 Tax=Burkholderia ambifaria TaxID=152480 RepID=UPI000F80AF0F|nr:hypothetical protein [Burkholderia ambifaria]
MTTLHESPAMDGAAYDAHRRSGLPTSHYTLLPEHPLIGTTLLERFAREYYSVERVFEAWWKGTYQVAVLRACSGDIYKVYVVGITDCLSEAIAAELALFEQRFEVHPACPPR